MQCDICFRTGGHRLPFLCPTDARNQLYGLRIEHAKVLLENDALEQQITNLLAEQDEAQQNGEPSQTRSSVADMAADRNRAIDRTQHIITAADELRVNVAKAREELARKKADVARRKSDLATATNGVEARRNRQVEEAKKSTRMGEFKWNQTHATTASSRTFLCGEAAKLYGLKKARRNSGTEEYRIGGVTIPDLRSMNTAAPAQISTALSHIVHLLMLSTHYLAIRLPAEITLPHRDYPSPTIMPLAQSYKHTNMPFPGTPVHSSSTSPTNSRHGDQAHQPLPTPRPLFVTECLPLLATKDQSGYGYFLEGVSLLAYNIAWLCKSQGVSVGGEGSFEDICNIGKNLYSLLIATRTKLPPPSRTPSAHSTPSRTGRETDNESEAKKNVIPSLAGKWSHGTAHSFLGSKEGIEFIRSWRLPSPKQLSDKLKSKLMSEVANAEWEMVTQGVDDDGLEDDGVVVGAKYDGGRSMAGAQSFMSMRTVTDATELIGGDDRKPGANGWTKLKPR